MVHNLDLALRCVHLLIEEAEVSNVFYHIHNCVASECRHIPASGEVVGARIKMSVERIVA